MKSSCLSLQLKFPGGRKKQQTNKPAHPGKEATTVMSESSLGFGIFPFEEGLWCLVPLSERPARVRPGAPWRATFLQRHVLVPPAAVPVGRAPAFTEARPPPITTGENPRTPPQGCEGAASSRSTVWLFALASRGESPMSSLP